MQMLIWCFCSSILKRELLFSELMQNKASWLCWITKAKMHSRHALFFLCRTWKKCKGFACVGHLPLSCNVWPLFSIKPGKQIHVQFKKGLSFCASHELFSICGYNCSFIVDRIKRCLVLLHMYSWLMCHIKVCSVGWLECSWKNLKRSWMSYPSEYFSFWSLNWIIKSSPIFFLFLLYREHGQEASSVRVGFVTYSNHLHFYNVKVN